MGRLHQPPTGHSAARSAAGDRFFLCGPLSLWAAEIILCENASRAVLLRPDARNLPYVDDRYTSAMQFTRLAVLILGLAIVTGGQVVTQQPPMFDVIIRGGTVYDGTGAAGRRADVGIRGDRIAAVGDLAGAQGTKVVDATGLAVAPGFINML